MDPESIVSFLERNWNTVREAPVVFVVLAVLMFGLAFYCVSWLYHTVIETQQQRIALKEDQLVIKDRQLAEYRVQAGLPQPANVQSSRLSTQELKTQVLRIVTGIRNLLDAHQSAYLAVDRDYSRTSTEATTEQEKTRLFQEMGNKHIEISQKLMADYNRHFKAEAILYRDEILTRLPANSVHSEDRFSYENPTNPLGVERVTTDLELLARSLP